MVMSDGSLKLIDFGAAKANSVVAEATYSIVLKQGYAPVEQYSRGGKQGPWTDVYGLCATIYECITGKILRRQRREPWGRVGNAFPNGNRSRRKTGKGLGTGA